jgi:hypothetical protein
MLRKKKGLCARDVNEEFTDKINDGDLFFFFLPLPTSTPSSSFLDPHFRCHEPLHMNFSFHLIKLK